MDLEHAIRSRRTHKVYGPEPVARQTLDELFELARWAPNHHLTCPWRFRVLGPEALARLKRAADELEAGSGAKLDRAPTLIAVSAIQSGNELADAEDVLATGVAAYVVLLGAHGRGLASYWRTPGVLRTEAGKAALGISEGEVVVGLLHLGPVRQERTPPQRLAPEDYVSYLD